MKIEPMITFRDVERSVDTEKLIYDNIDKLERVCDHIIGCRVLVELSQKHHHQGNPFKVRIDLTVPPKHEIVVKREARLAAAHQPLETLINQAFEAAKKRLRKLNDLQQGKVKKHETEEALL